MSVIKFSNDMLNTKLDSDTIKKAVSNPTILSDKGFSVLIEELNGEKLMWTSIPRPNTIWAVIKDDTVTSVRIEK